MTTVSLNSIYGIKNDISCSFIYLLDDSFDVLSSNLPGALEVPSLYGYILSYFQVPCEIEEAIHTIAKNSGIREDLISKFVTKILNNKTLLEIKYQGQTIILPPYLLIDADKNQSRKAKIFEEKEFDPFHKFIRTRPSSPSSVTIMLTSKCKTDCIYCYADRNNKTDFELEKIISLIDDCYQSGVLNLTLSGGDLFAYKEWKAVIEKMYACNYVSFISTKIPLSEEDVVFLQDRGVREIQFSLDAANADDLVVIVKRDASYLEEVKGMFDSCHKYGVKVNVKTVLTKYNGKVETLESLYDLLSIHQVYSWNIVPAFFSYYKEGYENYQIDEQYFLQCKLFIDKIASTCKFRISFRKLEKTMGIDSKFQTVDEFLRCNKGCITTSHNLSINVFGQVTICEMLYNRSQFQLGNAKQQTIKELWSSNLVKEFFNFDFTSMPRNPESPCYECKDYRRCKVGNAKKVCLVDIVNVFGEEKWDYPDPRCPHAPECNMDLLIK